MVDYSQIAHAENASKALPYAGRYIMTRRAPGQKDKSIKGVRYFLNAEHFRYTMEHWNALGATPSQIGGITYSYIPYVET